MRSHRSATLLGSGLVAALFVTGCGEEARQRPRVPEAPAKDAAAEPSAPEENVPPGSLSRARVDAVLRKGPPWLLAHVEVEEVLRKGTFIGWRIVSMPTGWEAGAEGCGLKPGDVVTRVNGLGLEKPDDFFSAWTAVAASKEIRVAYERDGKSEEVAMPIVGEPNADTKLALEQEPAPGTANQPKPGALPGPHETRVISNGEDAW